MSFDFDATFSGLQQVANAWFERIEQLPQAIGFFGDEGASEPFPFYWQNSEDRALKIAHVRQLLAEVPSIRAYGVIGEAWVTRYNPETKQKSQREEAVCTLLVARDGRIAQSVYRIVREPNVKPVLEPWGTEDGEPISLGGDLVSLFPHGGGNVH